MVKLDKVASLPRSKSGKLREQDLRLIKDTAIAEHAIDAQRALLTLKVSNIIAGVYLAGVIAFIFI